MSFTLLIFTLQRYITGKVLLDKKQLRGKSLCLFLVSILLLSLTIFITPFLENSILWKLDYEHTERLMIKLYEHYSLFIGYTFIRWVFDFDYYEYYHYDKGENYNTRYFIYLFVGTLVLSFVYEVGLEIFKKYFF